jgi:hypothetical protein
MSTYFFRMILWTSCTTSEDTCIMGVIPPAMIRANQKTRLGWAQFWEGEKIAFDNKRCSVITTELSPMLWVTLLSDEDLETISMMIRCYV